MWDGGEGWKSPTLQSQGTASLRTQQIHILYARKPSFDALVSVLPVLFFLPEATKTVNLFQFQLEWLAHSHRQCFQLLRSLDQDSGWCRRQCKSFQSWTILWLLRVGFIHNIERAFPHREAPGEIRVVGNILLLSCLRPKSEAHQWQWEDPLTSQGFGIKPQYREPMGMKFWKHGGNWQITEHDKALTAFAYKCYLLAYCFICCS